MRNVILICAVAILLVACNKKTNIEVRTIKKPAYTFTLDNVRQIKIITNDRCYLLNYPKTPVVCMTEEDFQANLDNYRIFLELAKQHKSSVLFYESIK